MLQFKDQLLLSLQLESKSAYSAPFFRLGTTTVTKPFLTSALASLLLHPSGRGTRVSHPSQSRSLMLTVFFSTSTAILTISLPNPGIDLVTVKLSSDSLIRTAGRPPLSLGSFRSALMMWYLMAAEPVEEKDREMVAGKRTRLRD